MLRALIATFALATAAALTACANAATVTIDQGPLTGATDIHIEHTGRLIR